MHYLLDVRFFQFVLMHPYSVQISPLVMSNSCFPVHHQLLELAQTHVHQVGDVIPFSSCPESFPGSDLFQGVSSSSQVAKVLEFSYNISPFNEYSGLISFQIDWLDLHAIQGTLKSLLQHHSKKHQFFSAQPSSQSNSHIHT